MTDTWVNINGARELARKYPAVFYEEAEKVMDIILARLDEETVKRTPVGVGGQAGLRGAYTGQVARYGKQVKALFGNPLPYFETIELGRRPGKRMPPVDAITFWVERKLGLSGEEAKGAAFAIARKIAIKGFEGKHMMGDAWESIENWAMSKLQTIPDRMVRRLDL